MSIVDVRPMLLAMGSLQCNFLSLWSSIMVSRQALCAVLYSLYVPELKEILSSIRRPNTNLNKEGLVNSVADIIREHNLSLIHI